MGRGLARAMLKRGHEVTVIDKELELYLEDFANIVSIERIEAVEILENVSSGDLDRVTYN